MAEEEEENHPLSWSVSLGHLMRRGSSDDEGEDETEALLSNVRADNERLRELVDDDNETVSPSRPLPEENAPSLSDLLGMCNPTPSESLEGGTPPTIDELLRMCEDDDDAFLSKLTGFICPKCLMVAQSQASLKQHFAEMHSEGVDDSRGLARMLSRASNSTKRRLVRRLRRLREHEPKKNTWLAAGAIGLAVALVGAPVTGLAVAAAAGAAHAARLRRDSRPTLAADEQKAPGDGTQSLPQKVEESLDSSSSPEKQLESLSDGDDAVLVKHEEGISLSSCDDDEVIVDIHSLPDTVMVVSEDEPT